MKDIKIFKKCKRCGHYLTLMESMRMGDDSLYVGVRCLNCGDIGFVELWKVDKKAKLQENPKNPFIS